MAVVNFISIGILVVLVGVVLVLIGIFLQAKGGLKVEGCGIVFIGPFPIIGGATSERAFYILIVFSLVFLTLFMLLNYVKL